MAMKRILGLASNLEAHRHVKDNRSIQSDFFMAPILIRLHDQCQCILYCSLMGEIMLRKDLVKLINIVASASYVYYNIVVLVPTGSPTFVYIPHIATCLQ